MMVIGWIFVFLCTSLVVFVNVLYIYDYLEAAHWLDEHLRREGQPVPERKGLKWRIFYWWIERKKKQNEYPISRGLWAMRGHEEEGRRARRKAGKNPQG